MPAHAFFYGEDQGRYVVTSTQADAVMHLAEQAGVPVQVIGRTGGDALTLGGEDTISLELLRRAHEDWLPAFMSGEDAAE